MSKLRTYPKKFFWRVYWVGLVASVILNFWWLYRHVLHYHFSYQYLPQFFAVFGFFGCMLLILIAKAMGFIIVVDEDYYQKHRKRRGDHVD